jgi:tetratricopeptide (TPR) repeat protein
VKPKLNLVDKSILFSSYFYLEEYDAALEIFLSIENELLEKSPENTPFVLCLAIEVAIAKFEDSLADRLRNTLLGYEDGEAFWAVSTCVRKVREDQGTQSDNIETLYQKYIELDKPIVIAEHLLRFLNVHNEKTEGKIIEVAERILIDKELDEACSLKLAEAYLKSGDANKVFLIVDKNLEKVNVDPHWHVIKTYALELSGRVGEAVDEIEKALKGNNYSTEHMKLYVNKCLSFGMFSQVEGVLQRLLSGENSRKNKLIYLSKLITVYSSSMEYRGKLISSIKRFGELVDRNDCDEEGRYLSFVLFTSINMTKEMKSAYSMRISDYFKKFPESKMLRKANVDVNNGPEVLLNSIREVTGVTDENIELWEKNKRSIRRGALPVPFAMLGLFLSNTRDIYTSWMLAKNTPEEALEFKINQASQSSQEIFDSFSDKGANFLVEETTLILMHELGILDSFLGNVQKFTILNSCFESMNVSCLFNSPGTINPLPQSILNIITKHRAKLRIEQDDKYNQLESYCKLTSRDGDGYIFLTDDANMLLPCGTNVEFLSHGNIYNILLSLNRNKAINDHELYELIAKVSTYGFKSINMTTNIMARVFCYFVNENEDYTKTAFKSLFDKVFNSRRKFDEVIGVLYGFLSCAIDESQVKISSNIILSLFTNFLLRHPHDSKVNFILNWFLYQCINGKESYISDLLPMSVTHAALWDVCYEMCCIAMERDVSRSELFSKISDFILKKKPDSREDIYNSVAKCFIPGTADYDSFSQTYKNLSLIRRVPNK